MNSYKPISVCSVKVRKRMFAVFDNLSVVWYLTGDERIKKVLSDFVKIISECVG